MAEHALALAERVRQHRDGDWVRRKKALIAMEEFVETARKSGYLRPAVFNPDVWRLIKEPLEMTLVRVVCGPA